MSEAPAKYPRGKNPRSLANLSKAWQKGESGNPAGRPLSGPVITPAMRRFADLSVNELFRLDVAKLTVAENIAVRYLIESLQTGYDRSSAEVIERLDGKVKEVKEISGKDGAPIKLTWDDGSPA